MTTPRIYEGSIYEGQRATLLARIVGSDGVPIKQADVSSIAVSYRNFDDTTVELATETPDKTVVIKDTLQLDGLWDEDEIGYNFLMVTGVGKLAQDGRYTYLAEVVITLTNDLAPVLFKINQLSIASTP
jgi:hypothetical protein